MKILIFGLGFLFAASRVADAASPYAQDWAVQYGTQDSEGIYSLASNSLGEYYATGYRYPSFGTDGDDLTRLQQILPDGSLGWQKSFASPVYDGYSDVATYESAIVSLSGLESRGLGGSPGMYEYDSLGNLLTASVIGFPDLDSSFNTSSLSVDKSGNVFLGGVANGTGFLAKINDLGQTEWTRSTDYVPAPYNFVMVAADDNGNVFLASDRPESGSPNQRIVLQKYDGTGNRLWSRSLGTDVSFFAFDLAVDLAGNALLAGAVFGDLSAPSGGDSDAFVLNVDADGDVTWSQQFSQIGFQEAHGVAVAPNGHIFVGGFSMSTPHVYDGSTADAFWAELDSDGTSLWSDSFGKPGTSDGVYGVLVDRNGDVVLGGNTSSALFGSQFGGGDSFLVKFDVNAVPEPAGFCLAILTALAGVLVTRRRGRAPHAMCSLRTSTGPRLARHEELRSLKQSEAGRVTRRNSGIRPAGRFSRAPSRLRRRKRRCGDDKQWCACLWHGCVLKRVQVA